MGVARQASTAATGRLVLELKTQREDERQYQFDKRLPIAEQLKVGGFILKIDGDSAVFSGPFGCVPHVSLQLIRSWKLRTHHGGNTFAFQANRDGLRHLPLNWGECAPRRPLGLDDGPGQSLV